MAQITADRTFEDYMTVGEAAEFLGISPWTLRNWDKSGKLKPARHPVSDYRLYRCEDLEPLLQANAATGKSRRTLTPNTDWDAIGDREHFVQFYETDKYLVDSVCAYIERALAAGDGAVIIVTPEHRRRIQRKLKRNGVDLAAVRKSGQFTTLDATETLSTFMVDDSPDPARFEASVGAVIARSAQDWPRVRAFGEMVALLWAEGKRDAACELESLWNDLAKRQPFALFCAYPLKAFQEEETGATLNDVCGCHSRVIPAESYSNLATPREQLRSITVLQQKAQRLKAEFDQRRAAERELSDFIENALEGLHKVGPNGTILWANKAELDLLGYEADDYIGHDIREFHVDSQAIDNALTRLLNGENVYNQPAVLRCKDGSLKNVLLHSNAYFEKGKFVYSRCFTRDMTEIRHADRDRAMLAAIIESSQDAIVSKTFDGIIQSWNGGAQRLFGYTEEEAVGQHITLIVPPERHGEEHEILARLRRGERIESYETVRIAKGGRRIDISLTISPLRDAAGNLIGASKIARDVTEQRRASARLHESEDRFRRLVELLPVGVYTCDAPAGTLTFYNEQAARLWGRSPEPGDTEERFCGSFKLFKSDGTYLPHEECPMAAALRDGQSFRNQEVEIERPDGTRVTALVNIDPIRDANGMVTGAINVFHDMTALKRAEQQLKDADRRKDEFIATLAHELRNPLAPVRNGLNILRMSGESAAAARTHEMMERQIAHMVRLIDGLLEISRISRGKIDLKKERTAVSAVIENALETTKPFIEAGGHALEVRLPEEPVMIEGDLVRLSQVFGNLLNNAAKFTPPGGGITVSATCESGEVVISIRDTGIGIPRDMLSRVFDMFAQVENPLRRSKDGLGIGLSLVRTLVQMHGGRVEALSHGLGHGSEFIVRLPVVEPESGDAEDVACSPPSTLKASPALRLLVVDDNRDAADSLGMMLKLLGVDVKTAYDGTSALEAIKIFRPLIVLMDLGMPGLDGLEAARRIREQTENRDMVLIALTGWGQEEDRRRSREAGFDDHLVKPVDIGTLQALLDSNKA